MNVNNTKWFFISPALSAWRQPNAVVFNWIVYCQDRHDVGVGIFLFFTESLSITKLSNSDVDQCPGLRILF